jgi:pilus assembly protein CpaC
VLSGYVTSPQDADIITRLATSAVGNPNNIINAVQVGGGQQVQIDVVVASVDRNMLRERGFDFSIPGSTVNFSSIVSGLITGTGGAGAVPTATGAANLQLGIIPAPFLAAMRALRTEGVAKFIAEPRVVTQSGRPASFLAGGRQAIISGTSGITGPGVELVPFGTELEVLPIVYGNGMIWLEINPRISTPNQALGLTLGGTDTPGFTEQQVRTAVMLESGQTYAIGGLIQNSISATSSKVPLLGDLPYFGTAFSRVRHQQTESELVILVTPRLVGPMNCDQVPRRLPGRETRNPDDYELFLENILEAPRGQRKVWNGRCYNAAWKCDPTAAIFPCVGNVCTGPNGMVGACGPNGACGPVGGSVGPTIYARPAVGGAAVPSTLPPLPGGSGGGRSDGADSAPGGFSAPPPVVVIPEFPRN